MRHASRGCAAVDDRAAELAADLWRNDRARDSLPMDGSRRGELRWCPDRALMGSHCRALRRATDANYSLHMGWRPGGTYEQTLIGQAHRNPNYNGLPEHDIALIHVMGGPFSRDVQVQTVGLPAASPAVGTTGSVASMQSDAVPPGGYVNALHPFVSSVPGGYFDISDPPGGFQAGDSGSGFVTLERDCLRPAACRGVRSTACGARRRGHAGRRLCGQGLDPGDDRRDRGGDAR